LNAAPPSSPYTEATAADRSNKQFTEINLTRVIELYYEIDALTVFFELAHIDVLDERKRVDIGEKSPLDLAKGKGYCLEISGDKHSILK
jgi:phenylalanine-4-hydroxylase